MKIRQSLGNISRKAGKWILPVVAVMMLATIVSSTFFLNNAMADSLKTECSSVGTYGDIAGSSVKGVCYWTESAGSSIKDVKGIKTVTVTGSATSGGGGLAGNTGLAPSGGIATYYYTADISVVKAVSDKLNKNVDLEGGITTEECQSAGGTPAGVGVCSWKSADITNYFGSSIPNGLKLDASKGLANGVYTATSNVVSGEVASAKKTYDAKVANQKKMDDCNSQSGKTWNSKTNTCDSSNTSDSTCNVSSGMGWIVCPVANLMAGIVDETYSLMNKLFVVPIKSFTDTGNGSVYSIYANNMLPLANIILVIVFLVIIYSEATGNGFGTMSNYSVKKTLPKLIVFAILINVSFYICVAAVDISNIVGSGAEQFLGGGTTVNFTDKTSQFLKDGSL